MLKIEFLPLKKRKNCLHFFHFQKDTQKMRCISVSINCATVTWLALLLSVVTTSSAAVVVSSIDDSLSLPLCQLVSLTHFVTIIYFLFAAVAWPLTEINSKLDRSWLTGKAHALFTVNTLDNSHSFFFPYSLLFPPDWLIQEWRELKPHRLLFCCCCELLYKSLGQYLPSAGNLNRFSSFSTLFLFFIVVTFATFFFSVTAHNAGWGC